MPYIVTVETPQKWDRDTIYGVTRKAVATYEEARQMAYDAMHDDQTCVGMARAEITLQIGRMP
jgi:hypothetical protein